MYFLDLIDPPIHLQLVKFFDWSALDLSYELKDLGGTLALASDSCSILLSLFDKPFQLADDESLVAGLTHLKVLLGEGQVSKE